jgi:hypothetical protein
MFTQRQSEKIPLCIKEVDRSFWPFYVLYERKTKYCSILSMKLTLIEPYDLTWIRIGCKTREAQDPQILPEA